MPNINTSTSVQDELNRFHRSAKKARMGDLLVHLIDNVNALRASQVALLAKLDTAGGSVAGLGTNYTSTITPLSTVTGVAITAITTLENRGV